MHVNLTIGGAMPKHRKLVAVALAVMAVTASSIAAANAAPDRAEGTRSATAVRQPSRGAQEYVVTFDGSADAAKAAISDAGGTVVSVNDELGIALVETTNSRFVAAAQAEGALTGVARNHSIGTTRPGMAHRFASERPTM